MTYPTVEQAMAAAMMPATAEVGDEVAQHETTCDLTDDCGCRLILYRLESDGWREVES